MKTRQLELAQLEQLRGLDSCSVANAIEAFDVRLRNQGFTDSSVHCLFPELPRMVGYAATARVRTCAPPMEGHSYYYRLDWLDHVLSIPAPRILILEDMDENPGLGAFVGDVHANILRALGCIGLVTNGAVRNLPEARALAFQMFAANASVSHAFAHIFDFGKPVVVGHMEVQPGDLIHGDLHGVQTIPAEIADKLPGVVREMSEQENRIIQVCRSTDFTVAKLRAEVSALGQKRKENQR
ncbi:MAG: RraA family protein [Acidobacteriia bacterium]|nr:RraA family protein [Terriglobia bacterium]